MLDHGSYVRLSPDRILLSMGCTDHPAYRATMLACTRTESDAACPRGGGELPVSIPCGVIRHKSICSFPVGEDEIMKQSNDTSTGRRRFLAGLTAIGGLTVTGSALSEGSPEPISRITARDDKHRSPGYRETEHVRAYYRSARD